MKYVYWLLGGLLALVAAIGILQFVASERVEVVELHTQDEAGETVTTRLWIVDHEGLPYLRGDTGSGWFDRLQANEVVKLTRKGETKPFRHEVRNENIDDINQLMRDKYTWGDVFIELMLGGRENSNAIALTTDQP